MITNRQVLRSSIATAALILILSTIVLAHGDQQHVMGTVTKIDSGSITVKTTTGEVKVVMVLPTTKFVRGSAAVTAQDVRVGDRVVIHAKPDGEMLHATEVKIGEAKDSIHHN
ncbi:MAG: DUF5666 domain-containing protein [Candidatus Sulfotelmatobacter sp.]|jgi:hypothetical protein